MSTYYPQETIDEVNSRLDIRRLMQAIEYRFEKYQENPKTAKGFCPIHREGLFRNLLIDVEARTFRCQYTQCPGSKGGNLVSLFAQAQGIDIDTAVRAIVRDQDLQVQLPVNEEVITAELQKAAEKLDAGDLDAAEEHYQEILEMHPESADAHHALLKIYESREDQEKRAGKLVTVCQLKIAEGKAGEIADLIQEWSEQDVDSPEARFACAELMYATGDAESAIMEFMGGGDACEGKGDLEAALHAYKRAATISADKNIDVIDVTPHIVRVLTQAERTGEALEYLHGLADKAGAAGNMDAATEFCILAIEADPDRIESHRRFLEVAAAVAPSSVISHHVIESSRFLREHNEHDAAINAMENYIAVAPQDESALQALINDYNNSGRAEDAFDLEARLARLLYERGRGGECREIMDRVLTWQPQHVPMLRVLADIQEQENLLTESRETHRRLIRALLAQKKFVEALDSIATLPTDAEQGEDLLELRASAYEGLAREGDRSSRELALETLNMLADLHLESTTGRRAIGYLQRAVELVEEPPKELLFKLARAYLRNKDFPNVRDTVITACENLAGQDRLDEAILEAERYSNLIPEDTDLVRYLVELYLRFDDKQAAVARMRRLSEELTRTGRVEEAEEVLEQANDLEPQDLATLTRQLEHYRQTENTEKIQQSYLRLATFHEQQGNYPQAAKRMEDYLQGNPADSSVILRLIQAYEKVQDEQQARQWRLQLARVYRSASDSDREARVLRDVLVKFPDDEEALHMLMNAEFSRTDMQSGVIVARRLAGLQKKAGKTEASRKTLLKAVERVPENLELNQDIFEYYRDARHSSQALTWGKKLISILRTASKNADAAIVFDQLVALDPDNLVLKQEQLKFLEETGRDAEVSEKRLGLAKVYRDQERFQDAEAMLESILAKDSRNLIARRQLADLHLHLGENSKAEAQLLRIAGIYHLEDESQKAIEVLRQVLAANTANGDARRQLAQIYRAEGNATAAVTELLDLADSYRKQHMEVEALAMEREALEMDPANTSIGRRVADSLKSVGRHTQAADELEAIASRRAGANQLEEALKVYDEMLELEPGRLATRKARADILTKMGRPELALEELRVLADLAVTGSGANGGAGGQNAAAPIAEVRPQLQLVAEYTFENFVVGANNDFAYATALAIARSPARAYNPLFLYANVGLGKTHLCNGIANYLLEHDPKASIIYTNSEDFTDELIEAIQNNAVQQFRTRYRSLDLFIVDDVQFLAGKERAQEEFFHIFNSLFQARRQIVIACDRPPAEISHLEGRLRSRFGAGVIVDIASPDLETRLAILNREIEENELKLEPWVARLLAERIDSNVRDLKGALNQVVAMRDLRKQPVTEKSVSKMMDTLYPIAAV